MTEDLDDMSDISDGDIPDVPETEGAAKSSLDKQIEEEEETVEDLDEQQRQQQIDIPEDMEEISDEEADWSDDGDCFFLDPDSYRVDFGSDWVEPTVIFKPEEHALTELKYYGKEAQSPSVDPDSTNLKVEKLNQMPLGSEWVEALETLDVSSIESTKGLTSLLQRGLSLSEALKQPVHTFKLRHLKSGLKFANSRGKGEAQKIEGLGGTRYCDWWFAENAVLIDETGVEHPGVDLGGEQVVGGGDDVDIAGEMEVELVHRDYL